MDACGNEGIFNVAVYVEAMVAPLYRHTSEGVSASTFFVNLVLANNKNALHPESKRAVDCDGGDGDGDGVKLRIIHSFFTNMIIYMNFPIFSKEFTAPSVTSHNVGLGGVILVDRGPFGTVGTCIIQSYLITM
jgi:hypothetical protein